MFSERSFTGTYLRSWLRNTHFRGSRKAINAGNIAISFDDGPNAKVTPKVLDILNANNVQATFFWIADNAKALKAEDPSVFDELMAKINLGGHEIGYHAPYDYVPTLLNRLFGKFSREELLNGREVIEDLTQRQMSLYRPHFLHLGGSIRVVHDEMGLTPVIGDLLHFPKANGDRMKQIQVASKVGPGGVLILHDGVSLITSATFIEDVLPSIIANLRSKGLNLVPLSRIL